MQCDLPRTLPALRIGGGMDRAALAGSMWIFGASALRPKRNLLQCMIFRPENKVVEASGPTPFRARLSKVSGRRAHGSLTPPWPLTGGSSAAVAECGRTCRNRKQHSET